MNMGESRKLCNSGGSTPYLYHCQSMQIIDLVVKVGVGDQSGSLIQHHGSNSMSLLLRVDSIGLNSTSRLQEGNSV